MNITPEFMTSRQFKKFKKELGHPAATEMYVNLCCQLEGITRKPKADNGCLGTTDPEEIAFMCNAEQYEDLDDKKLTDALLVSSLMIEESGDYRVISWEENNANLLKNRKNGRKGGRPSSKDSSDVSGVLADDSNALVKAERNDKGTLNSNDKGNLNSNLTELEHNQTKTEQNETITERNVTGGLTQTEPSVNPGLYEEEVDNDDFPW